MRSSTAFLHSDISLFRYPLDAARRGARGRPRRCGRIAVGGSLHRAVDEQTGAIRAFDLPIRTEIEKDSGMAMRLVAAIARGDRLIYVDRFGRPHMPPRNGAGADHTRLTVLTSTMIRFAARQSMTPYRPQLWACGIDKSA